MRIRILNLKLVILILGKDYLQLITSSTFIAPKETDSPASPAGLVVKICSIAI